MQKINYFMAGTFLLAATSCGNAWLDLEPSTSMNTEQTIQELSNVEMALNGVYNTMQDAYAYSGRLIYYGDATGDDMQAYSATKRTGDCYTFSYTKDNAPSSYWEYPYNMITLCNVILGKIDGLPAEGEEELRDTYKGQALALRGMFLFDLTRLYGYPYKKDNGASLGVPIVTEELDKNAKPSRNTVAECYQQVIDDLTEAATLLDNSEGTAYNKGHINRWGVLSLLSRVYLYHGDNQLALNVAEEAISGAEAEGYALWTNAEYLTAWGSDAGESNKGEVLFEVVNTTDDSPGKESLGYLHSEDGYRDIIVTSSYYALIHEDPADVRSQLFTYYSKRAFIHKYQPQAGENVEDANIPLLRLSETYLNAAEAAVKVGDNNKAVEYLDAIVSRANPANTVAGTTVSLERVMTERRKELVGEGQRMFDALRDGGYVDRHDVEGYSEISSTSHLISNKDKLYFNWDYYKCVLPIPKAEMDANENMVQNPGYDAAVE